MAEPITTANRVALRLANCAPLRAFVVVVTALWLLTLLVGLTEHLVFHLPSKYWWPLFSTRSGLDDFNIYTGRFHHFHQASFFVPWKSIAVDLANFPFTYPAPAALVFRFFFLFGLYSETAMFCAFLLGAVAATLLFGRALRRRGLNWTSTAILLLIAGVLSYPILFAVDRGNIELINVVLVWATIACVWNQWWYKGAILLGLAISIKLFPFVLLGIFVAQRKYLQGLLTICIAALSTALSYIVLGPTFAVARAGIASGLEFFKQNYVLATHLDEAGFDHSIFTLLKLVHKAAYQRIPTAVSPDLTRWLSVYLLVATLSGLILFFGRVIRLPLTNQIVVLVAASLLLPPLSADYTLMHLYAPFACLALVAVSASVSRTQQRGIVLAMLLFGVLMAPESFLIFHGTRLSGLLKTAALGLLIWTAATVRWYDQPVPDGFGLEPAVQHFG